MGQGAAKQAFLQEKDKDSNQTESGRSGGERLDTGMGSRP